MLCGDKCSRAVGCYLDSYSNLTSRILKIAGSGGSILCLLFGSTQFDRRLSLCAYPLAMSYRANP